MKPALCFVRSNGASFQVMTEPLLIAQISDLHIKRQGELAYRRVDTAGALSRLIAELNRFRPRPAFVVITGDLVDAGQTAQYENLDRLLSNLELPFAAVPGNHDERQAFRKIFSSQNFTSPAGPANARVSVGPLELLLLDSSVPGSDYGRLGAETLGWLEAKLADAPDRPAIVFLHHPPFVTGIGHMDRQNLHDAAALRSVLERHPQVRLVAAGHVHRAVTTSFAGVVTTICPASSHAVDLDIAGERAPSFRLEPPGFHLQAFFPDGRFGNVVTHFVPVGDFGGPYPFFDQYGQQL
jgi:3',5'-cyclic-AMP phosphodiesterase